MVFASYQQVDLGSLTAKEERTQLRNGADLGTRHLMLRRCICHRHTLSTRHHFHQRTHLYTDTLCLHYYLQQKLNSLDMQYTLLLYN
jgi:hypothetical protein